MFPQKCSGPVTAVALLLGLAACNASSAIPPSSANAPSALRTFGADSNVAPTATDETSILKTLTKDVVIGSTVDPKNGDTGPHSLAIVQGNGGSLKKGQLVFCNFDDKSGGVGKGTTIDIIDPRPGSKPSTFVQTGKIEGCDGAATTSYNDVYGAGFASGSLVGFSDTGKAGKTYGSPLAVPFDDVDIGNKGMYSTEYVFTSDAKTGAIVSVGVNSYAQGFHMQVADGFDVNAKPGWSRLGPSGLRYDKRLDVLYVADGVDDVIDAFTNAHNLLVKNEIVVEKRGTAFKCAHPKTTCGERIFSGKPLDAPVAMALLPNGNLIVANSAGGNTLVEIAANGKVLDTKVVDKSKTAGIYALAATGTSDSDTVLFYTDANTNTVHELER